MGLLDSVMGAAGKEGGLGGALGAALGGGQGDLLKAVLAMLDPKGPGGGLPGLVQKFQQGGLGEIIASWISTGPNLPVSAQQLKDVLGPEMLSGLATKLGLGADELAGPLAQLLPQLVDKMTPQGQLPAPGADTPDLGALLGGLLGR